MRKLFISSFVLLFCSMFLFSEESITRYRYSFKDHDTNNSWIVIIGIIDTAKPLEDEIIETFGLMPLNNDEERDAFEKAWGGWGNISDAFEQGAYKGVYYDFTNPDNIDMKRIYGSFGLWDYVNGTE